MSGEHSCECGCHRGDGRDPSMCRCQAATPDARHWQTSSGGSGPASGTSGPTLNETAPLGVPAGVATPDASALRTSLERRISDLTGRDLSPIERGNLGAYQDVLNMLSAALASGDTEPER